MDFTLTIQSDLTGVLAGRLRREVATVVKETAEEVAADYKLHVTDNTGKFGRIYKRAEISRAYKTGGKRANQFAAMGLDFTSNAASGKTSFVVGYKVHQASLPGQAPATDTGDLAAAIQVDDDKADTDLYADVVNGTEYALALELGSDHLAARPALVPALDAARNLFWQPPNRGD